MKPESPVEPTKIVAFLRDIPLFARLDLHTIGHIAASVKRFTLSEGEILITEGSEAEDLFLIYDGRLRAVSSDEQEGEITLGEIAGGEVVGERALLTRESRSATIRCLTDVIGYTLNGEDFRSIVNQHPDEMKWVSDLIMRRHMESVRARYRPSREHICELLGEIDLFSSLSESTIRELEPFFQWKTLFKGEVLMYQGELGTSLYVVVSGRLKFEVREDDNQIVRSGFIERGEVVGESSLLTQEPRNATVSAARTSDLLTLPPYALTRLVLKYPLVLLEVTRLLARRMRHGGGKRVQAKIQSAAIIPMHNSLDVQRFAEGLTQAIGRYYAVEQLRAGSVKTGDLARRIDTVLNDNTMPLALGVVGDSAWNTACLHSCDTAIFLADPKGSPGPTPLELSNRLQGRLVFLHSEAEIGSADISPFLVERKDWDKHHIRKGSITDIQRLARFLTGRSIGLALGGGGARGLAQIGVVQALREEDVPIDLVIGTSIGALVGAAVAEDRSVEEMTRGAWKYLVKDHPLRDPSLPLVSLLKGRKITSGIRRFFGTTKIENLPLLFSTVSTDLAAREVFVMDNGPIWKAVRSSLAIPGLIPPVFHDGRLLADGGLLNNAPADIAVKKGAHQTILVDVSGSKKFDGDSMAQVYRNLPTGYSPGLRQYLQSRFRKDESWTGIGEVMLKSLLLGSYRSTLENAEIADFYMRLPVQQYSMLNFKVLDELIEIGYRSTLANLEMWKAKLNC
jgi:NTE family protein